MEIEGLSSAGNDGDGRMVPVMFAFFLAGWVLGNQAGFHCGEVVFRLCSLGVLISRADGSDGLLRTWSGDLSAVSLLWARRWVF